MKGKIAIVGFGTEHMLTMALLQHMEHGQPDIIVIANNDEDVQRGITIATELQDVKYAPPKLDIVLQARETFDFFDGNMRKNKNKGWTEQPWRNHRKK